MKKRIWNKAGAVFLAAALAFTGLPAAGQLTFGEELDSSEIAAESSAEPETYAQAAKTSDEDVAAADDPEISEEAAAGETNADESSAGEISADAGDVGETPAGQAETPADQTEASTDSEKAATEEASAEEAAGETEAAETALSTTAKKAAPKKAAADEDKEVYALVNIPYSAFYAGEGSVDAISSATIKGKARNVNVNGASYHRSEASATSEGIAGTTYPVKAKLSDLASLGGKQITSEDSVSYELSARGSTTLVTLSGQQALQEAPDYSYYVLDEEPAGFKELTVTDGVPVFSAAQGSSVTESGASGSVTLAARHADVEISLSGVSVTPADVSGVIVTADGTDYALHHVVNIWRGTEIGWDSSDLDLTGETLSNVRYYLKDGRVIDYPVEIEIAQYALMNIPYADFYQAEGGGQIDAVSSATMKKTKDPSRVGGSYHVSSDGSDISGGIYPVRIGDTGVLDIAQKVTPEEGQTAQEALFENASYAYCLLSEKPAAYKEVSVDASGALTFAAATGTISTGAEVTGTPVVGSRHDDIEMKLSGIQASGDVAGVILETSDGSQYFLRHQANLWKDTQIGWNYDDAGFEDLFGKTLTNLRYFYNDGTIIDYPCQTLLEAYVLMNIPYADFYEAEGPQEVDAVSSATMTKTRSSLAAGSYHVNADGSDISGIIYPVKVTDTAGLIGKETANKKSTLSITVTLRGQETTTDYTGSDCLFEMPDYSYFGLDAEPTAYKEMTVSEDGSISFGPSTGQVSTVEGVTGALSLNARHADAEIKLSGLSVEAGDTVSAVVLTTDDGSSYALRHVVNIWRSVEIGWNFDDAGYEDLAGKTITNIRYYMPDGSITDYPVSIEIGAAVYNEDAQAPALLKTDSITEDGFAAYLQAISTVTVGETAFSAEETPIIDPETGAIDLNAQVDGAYIFTGDVAPTLLLSADGYPDYSFTIAAPEMLEGDGATRTIESGKTLTFRSDANFAYLRSVAVDGKLAETADYDAAEGSTVITLHADYLDSLGEGTHTIAIASGNGTASASFENEAAPAKEPETKEPETKQPETKAQESNSDGQKTGGKGTGTGSSSGKGSSLTGTKTPSTGDSMNVLLQLSILLGSAAVLCTMLVLFRRKRKA